MNRSLNLLPVEEQRQAILKPALRRWLFVGVICLIANAALTLVRMSEHQALMAHETAGRTAAETTRQLMASLTSLDGRIQALRTQLHGLEHLHATPDPLNLVRAIHEAAHEETQHLLFLSMDISHAKPAATPAGSPPANSSAPVSDASQPAPEWCRTTLQLTGRASSDLTIAKFVNGLRNSGHFDIVQLKSTRPTALDGRFNREFVLECIRREATP